MQARVLAFTNGRTDTLSLGSTMEFSHYAPAPNNIAETVIAKSKGKVKVEEE